MSETIVKHLNFGDDAKNKIFEGINKLTKAVSSTLGASGRCVILEDGKGNPQITKDGVTVANSVILLGYIMGGILRGLIVGLVVTIVAELFTNLGIQHFIMMIFVSH